MEQKEKWVNLFEKVVGRKPTGTEFLEGKKSDFKLTEIRRIAGLDAKTSVDSQSEDEVLDIMEFSDEEVVESVQQPIVRQEAVGEEFPSSQEVWVTSFEKYIGRKPLPAEFVIGKQSGFDLTSIHQFLTVSPKPPKIVKAPLSKAKKILITLGVVLGIALVAGYMYGSKYYSRQAVAERYAESLNNYGFINYEVWSDNNQAISEDSLKYLPKSYKKTTDIDNLLYGDSMKNVGSEFLVFPKWRVPVKPVSVTLSSNTKDLDIFINGKKFGHTNSDKYSKKVSNLYPGTYNFTAKGKVSDQDIEISTSKNLKTNENVSLNVRYISFTIQSNITDGELVVGSKVIGNLADGKAEVSNLPVADSSSIYVRKKFSETSQLDTEKKDIADIENGSTVILDSDKILSRDTANDVIKEAYEKLQSYANNSTTPYNLDDIFKNGSENSFYKDVKNTIDTNTTGAKNRSADSINFKNVDVTAVKQTGENTYLVEFTVVYDFYYGYNSKNKDSGHLVQKLAWSANIVYDKNSKAYSDYENYKVESSGGESKVLDTQNDIS